MMAIIKIIITSTTMGKMNTITKTITKIRIIMIS